MTTRRTLCMRAFSMACAGALGNGARLALAGGGRSIHAGPLDYLAKLRAMQPGDTLVLTPGRYDEPGAPGLPLFDLNGSAAAPITITGPAGGARPLLLGRARHNTVRLANSSYLVIRNLDIDGLDLGGDGVKAQGPTHDIVIENLRIRGVGPDQSVVGISTAGATAWNWTVRGNTIVNAGTGMYLGNSNGLNPFVAGIIEGNVIRDSIGYNLQIKHQLPWAEDVGAPAEPTVTIIRHNVFGKGDNSSTAERARPNLLVGDVPPSGPGSANGYAIYANLFYRNPGEALFQGEGNIGFYANLLFNDGGPGIRIQRHNGRVRRVDVFGNTVVARATGIALSGGDAAFAQRVIGNAVFAATPIVAEHAADNATGGYDDAKRQLVRPAGSPAVLDLHPRPGRLRGRSALSTPGLEQYPHWHLDADGRLRDWTVRGAFGSSRAGAQRSLWLDIGR